jgi:small subunit ribosomal protein S3
MGQKVIPISLRLNKKKNWNSNWIVSKNMYSDMLYFDLEIKKYFKTILNTKDIKTVKIDIKNFSQNIYVYVYLQKHPNIKYNLQYNNIINNLNLFLKNKYNIKIFLITITTKNLQINKNIAKIFKFLKKNNKLTYNFKRIIYVFTYAIYTKNFEMISKFIQQNLQKKKIHKGYIRFINKMLKTFFNIHSNFLGYKLQIKGRINGIKRSRKLIFQEGKIPLNTLKNDIHYTFDEFITPSGICSIKLWVFLKNNSNRSITNKNFIKKKRNFYLKKLYKKNVISKKN